jgi:hypothetical protein
MARQHIQKFKSTARSGPHLAGTKAISPEIFLCRPSPPGQPPVVLGRFRIIPIDPRRLSLSLLVGLIPSREPVLNLRNRGAWKKKRKIASTTTHPRRGAGESPPEYSRPPQHYFGPCPPLAHPCLSSCVRIRARRFASYATPRPRFPSLALLGLSSLSPPLLPRQVQNNRARFW